MSETKKLSIVQLVVTMTVPFRYGGVLQPLTVFLITIAIGLSLAKEVPMQKAIPPLMDPIPCVANVVQSH